MSVIAWLRQAPGVSPRRDGLLLILVTVLVYLGVANHSPLGSTTRYYEAARETLELGTWAVPHLGYVPYLEKPPLVYWLGALAQMLGSGPLLANVPSLLAALVTVLATWRMATSWRGPRVGLAAAFLYLGLVFPQILTGVLATDPLLAACLAVAWWMGWEWVKGGSRERKWLWGFYCAIAVGWMVKGPVALILPAAALSVYAFLSGGPMAVLRLLVALRPWLGVGLIVAVNLPWTLVVWAQDPRLIEFFYIDINFAAFFAGSFNHPEPIWYYVPVLLAVLMPYTFVSLPVFFQGAKRVWQDVRIRAAPVPADPGLLYFTCVVLGPFLFLSASSAKLATYLLPLIPALAVVFAVGLAARPRVPRWAVWVTGVQAAVLALVGIGATVFAPVARAHAGLTEPWVLLGKKMDMQALAAVQWSLFPLVLAAFALIPIGGALATWLMQRQRLAAALAAQALGIFAFLAIVLPQVDALVPARDNTILITALRAAGGDNPALPVEQRDPVIIHQSVVHDYDILLALQRRAIYLDHTRELGLGHFIEATPKTTPFPGPGQPIERPYDVSGENQDHPWLWSHATFAEHCKQEDTRLWLICSDRYGQKLIDDGLPLHVIATSLQGTLYSNRP